MLLSEEDGSPPRQKTPSVKQFCLTDKDRILFTTAQEEDNVEGDWVLSVAEEKELHEQMVSIQWDYDELSEEHRLISEKNDSNRAVEKYKSTLIEINAQMDKFQDIKALLDAQKKKERVLLYLLAMLGRNN